MNDSQPGPYQLFMLILCVFVLLALAVEVLLPIPEDAALILQYVDTGVCVIFMVDFFGKLIKAPNKLEYLKWGWIDFVSSIPAIGFLRIGRLARVFRIIRLLRGVKSSKALVQYLLQKRAQSVFAVAALISILLLTFSSIAILQVEVGPDSNIQSAEDAFWWSVVTITTVGYGDHFPVSTEGRVIATVLMVCGVGMFGTFTGFVASWFTQPGESQQEDELSAIKSELAEIKTILERDNL